MLGTTVHDEFNGMDENENCIQRKLLISKTPANDVKHRIKWVERIHGGKKKTYCDINPFKPICKPLVRSRRRNK